MTGEARLSLLDGFALACAEGTVDVPRTLQRLLAFLGLRGRASRAHAIGVLWPESDEQRALGSLRTALWRLHQLGAPVVAAQGETLRLHDWVRVDVDDLVLSAKTAAVGDEPPDVLDLRMGGLRELLPGWFDDWVLIERERLRQLYLHTMERLAANELRQGKYGEAVESTLAAMRAEPLRETPHRLLLEIHLAEGNYSEALNTYHSYRVLLRRELGVGPSPEMQRLLHEADRADYLPSAG
ncbi:AfsR/SARP family transcriptional regulator [Amycolatopsis anabasis]|uniref:AfsR/SARP family transcriptional regulator n=1 Tax=Amycolatopsis anabasis TaxID=1840409 RepID=UPI00131D852A|nr:BTAD domain-containing putative transcriptional regulator [Amycolatopsis anabasis]